MADSEMIEHISKSKMEFFCARGLPETELVTAARHLVTCADCHQQFVATLRRHREVADLSFTLAPEFWLRHEHVDYEEIVGIANDKVEATDREVIDVHLKVCPPCREDVQSFLAFREQIAPELGVSYTPIEQQSAHERLSWASWWRGLAWKPIYGAAMVLIGILLIIGGLVLKRRADNFQARQTPSPNTNLVTASQSPTPVNTAANGPSPLATPDGVALEEPNGGEAIVVLKDGPGTVMVDKSGGVAGLDDVPRPTREEIARVLLSNRLEPPASLKELGGQGSTLRGTKNAQPFRLTYPSRTVIVSDQPTFRWGSASGANSYRVYVNDPAGNEIAKSEELPSERTEWKLPTPLKRGGVYLWTVVAVVDGNEVVSPGPSSAEMKFKVLSTSGLLQLDKLIKTRSHLALGVFYAREGMIAEAERELRILARGNPSSQPAKKLLSQVQSWRSR